ncbi:MAG: hypothetical protein ACE5MH_06215, partial [Terriglobia bacterium]
MQEPIEHTQNQRVRFKLGQLEIELEGPAAYDEFHRLQERGFGKLATDNRPAFAGQPSQPGALVPRADASQPIAPDGKPSLSDLAVRDVARSEREWIVVYGYYISEADGKKAFSRGDVWEKYKQSGRDNSSRQANLYENINRAVKAG